MNVYVEYVVLDNFVIDSLLLWAVALTLRISYKWWRIALGGAVGAACAVVSVFVGGVWLYLLKTACLLSMCVVSVGFGKKLFWHILLTLAYTFVLGGAVIGLFNLFQIDYVNGDGQFYQMKVPLFVYAIAVALVGFLCYSIVIYVKNVRKTAPYRVQVQIELDKSYTVDGFCDSGNSLYYDGIPVCFVTKSFKGFKDYFVRQTLCGKVIEIEVATVAGTQKVAAVAGKIALKGEQKKVYLALPKEKCQTEYNILLSSEFCGGE
ncbi:MAG: sigma-E processing peptidase SpoIIGA [Clostridiales bacterium]|nr:sigma-E processing peptidase SpoIIGA [Clostridiales bacterium]